MSVKILVKSNNGTVKGVLNFWNSTADVSADAAVEVDIINIDSDSIYKE